MAKTGKLHLIRDVLDKLLVDRNQLPVGRADGIVLVIRGEHTQPRVAQIECGMPTLARRLSIRGARGLYWFSRRLGLHWHRQVRIDWRKVENVGREITLDIDSEPSRLLSGDRWLRNHVI